MRVAITGASGSLGQALLRRLTRVGGADRIVAFSRDEQKRARLVQLFGWHPAVRVYAGDIRDPERLIDLFHGCEAVVHGAARKVVTAHPDEAEEMLKTNVLGSVNVIRAARRAGVRKVIVVSSDKACLDYHAPVSLADGRTMAIRQIVASQHPVDVLTLTPDGIQSRSVTAWYKVPLRGTVMVGVSYAFGPRWGRGVPRAWVTEDHPVLTIQGWKRADALSERDVLVTAERAPNWRLRGAILGWALGDAHITRGGMLKVAHAADQAEWVALSHRLLAAFDPTPIRVSRVRAGRQAQHSFTVSGQSYFRSLRDRLYPVFHKKRVDLDLVNEAYSPEFLAAWYLDDGCRDANRARLATHGFPQMDVEALATLLTERGLPVYPYRCRIDGRTYWELRFTAASSYRLFEIIGRYVVPSLRYKVPPWAPPYDAHAWTSGTVQFTAEARLAKRPILSTVRPAARPTPMHNKGKTACLRGHRLTPDNIRMTSAGGRQCRQCVRERARLRRRSGVAPRRDVYCVDVAETHNFVVNGVVVHNCRAENVYGVSKALMEHLAINANARTQADGLRVGVVRYGNVVGSNGSVVAVWRTLLAAHQPIPVSNPDMTRFWISMPQAVDLILYALSNLRGGEVIVPHLPAASVGALARAVGGEGVQTVPVTDVPLERRQGGLAGIRQGGEKIHEELLSAAEVRRAVRRTGYYVVPPYQHDEMWDSRPWLGTPVDPDLVYRSDVWEWQATVDELRLLLEDQEVPSGDVRSERPNRG
jgi:nucleoside-diphosphate-sugar epimerase